MESVVTQDNCRHRKMGSKHENFHEVLVGDKIKYKCSLCSRQLSSKQNILNHLHNTHNLSPVKRQKKLYLDDKQLDVPPRTAFRWKRRKIQTTTLSYEQDQLLLNTNSNFASHGVKSDMITVETAPPTTPHRCKSRQIDSHSSDDLSLNSANMCSSNLDDLPEVMYSKGDGTNTSTFSNTDISILSDSISNTEYSSDSDKSDTSKTEQGYPSDSDKSDTSTTEPGYPSHSDESDTSTTEPEYTSDSDNDETCITEHLPGSDNDDTKCKYNTSVLTNEQEALKIVSCFRRHNLTTSACKDIIDTVRCVFKDSKNAHILNYNYLMSFVETNPLNEVHYCEFCNEVFPSDLDEFQCNSFSCGGLRYQGPRSKQNSSNRQPRKCFIVADVNKQLTDLLQSPGIMDDIREQKDAAHFRKDDDTITDITDGSAYRNMLNGNEFLSTSDYNLTAIINTDGVNLYSSSKVELWPVFMAINELNPKARFSRENLLLVAIWQGKGKPPFKQYIESIAPQLNSLYNEGIDLTVNGNEINVKVKVVCGVFDLPAKAGMLNMTYYNGQDACITCEEHGLTVKQGKGTSRSYPDRNGNYTLRTHDDVMNCMQLATDKKRIKGFKGMSGITSIQSFDLVDGILPDYMHAVLLGVTNRLMVKWFSPTESKQRYFIGRHLKKISGRLQSIRPPASIERLPRDLEKNYRNLKATELQAWLLFYALPCLVGILPDVYLRHFSYLSEAMYILLGDRIKRTSLEKAEHLLNAFYADFVELYGAGSCGLNVHNTCVHLIHYVKLWGPLWAWSCFGFEDNNAMLLQAVHGTGVVTKQIMLYKQVEATLRRKSGHENKSRLWKKTYQAANCDVSGKMVTFENGGIEEDLLLNLGVGNIKDVKQIERICVNGRPFCSLKYTRMRKRVCSYVLYGNSRVGCVKYFVIVTASNIVYAVLEQNDTCEDAQISELPAGKHLIPVKSNGTVDVVPAESLIDTLVYIKVNPEIRECVALMPSRHGHAIFK